jgi:hypothetical protein
LYATPLEKWLSGLRAMKFLAGFVTAFIVCALGAFLVIVSGVYNVAATALHTALVRVILNWTMRNSVRAHAGNELRETWSEDQARKGFKNYDEMCVICHSAPGKRAQLHQQRPATGASEPCRNFRAMGQRGAILDHQKWRQNDRNARIRAHASGRADMEYRGLRSPPTSTLRRAIQGDGGRDRKILRE